MANVQVKGGNGSKGSKAPAKSASKAAGSPLMDLRSEIDRLFSDFSSRFPAMGAGGSLFDWDPFRVAGKSGGAVATFTAPHVDLTETDKSYEIVAELPGLDEKDVTVEFTDNVLTVSGEKREEKEEKKKDYHLSERRFGSFKRSFRLPGDVDESKADARFEKGVLRVVLPKSAAPKPKTKKIEVKAK